jgi:hypothetical protein
MSILDAQSITFEKLDSGTLSITQADGTTISPVHCVRLFPLSDSEHYISVLRSEKCDEPEIGILRDMNDLPETQRSLILDDLAQRHFLPEIQDVTAILMSNGMDEWHVITDRGDKIFFVSSRKDNITITDSNMLIVTDVEKCRYRIPDYTALSPQAFDLVGRALP